MERRALILVLLLWLVARLAGAETWSEWVEARPDLPPVPVPIHLVDRSAELELELQIAESNLEKWGRLKADLVAGEGAPWAPKLERVLQAIRAGGPRWRYLVPVVADLAEVARGERDAGDVDQLVELLAEVDRIRAGWLRRAIADPCPRLRGELRARAGLPRHYVPPHIKT